MGWNEVRIGLVPVGWKMIAEIDRTACTMIGSPATILHTIPDVDIASQSIDPRTLRHVLEQEGFGVSQHEGTFLRMNRGEIEAFLAVEHGVLSEIVLTFTLSRSSPSRIPDWQRVISHLLRSNGLALVDRMTQERVDCQDFLRVLTNSPAWREFATRFGWPEVTGGCGDRPIEVAAPEAELAKEDPDLPGEMFPTVEETWPGTHTPGK
jgi:hypothetical protein